MHGFCIFYLVVTAFLVCGSPTGGNTRGTVKNAFHLFIQSLKKTTNDGLEKVMKKLEEAETIAKNEFEAILEKLEEEDPEVLRQCCNDTNCEKTSNAETPPKPSDCAQLYRQGKTKSGIYTINPKPEFKVPSIKVFCDMVTDGGGWTVFQRRDEYDVRENFNRNWSEYKNGFGNLEKEFWLGNSQLYVLTNQDHVTLRVDLEDFDGNQTFVKYDKFHVASTKDEYRLTIDQILAGPGDQFMEKHNNQTFKTADHYDIHSCAKSYKGGWWYEHCYSSYLNGVYNNGTECRIRWAQWQSGVCLKKSEMKIWPTNFDNTQEN